MTVTEESRHDLLERYGRWYGQERFAVTFTAAIEGEAAKRVTSKGWDQTPPLAGGDFGAGMVGARGQSRNPAIVLRPSNLVVLECDTEQDLVAIEQLNLPATITVRSSAPYKRHFYFRPPHELERLPYVAFRFESGQLTADAGRYFLAPPAIHPSGAIYAFLPDRGPDDVDIAELPEPLYHQLAETARADDYDMREHLRRDPTAKVPPGKRRETIFKVACAVLRWSESRAVVSAAAHAFNQANCDPPVTHEQVEMQVDGAMKFRPAEDLERVLAELPDQAILDADPGPEWAERAVPVYVVDKPDDTPHHEPEPLRIVTLDEFVSVTEDVADPLIGTPEDCLLPSDGLLLMYGDGGAGKTTLSIDALAHLSAGQHWINITVARPLRLLLIENEGPRGEFRRRLNQKIEDWAGDTFSPNVVVLEEPWTRFTITDQTYRHGLGQEIDRLDVDLVIVGPLASLGAKGTGTPDEINEFDNHIKNLRAHTVRTFALWIVHHENKAGDVSGAWERYPDTLVHVQAQGNGRTRVYWRKVRWSSTLHQTSSNLLWEPGRSFKVEEEHARDYHQELEHAFRQDDKWRTAKESADLIAANVDKVKKALSDLVKRGVLTTQKGPSGRHANAVCWRLSSDSEALSHTESHTPLEGFAGASDSLTPPMKESVEESDDTEPDESVSPDAGETSQNKPASFTDDPELMARIYNDDIPF